MLVYHTCQGFCKHNCTESPGRAGGTAPADRPKSLPEPDSRTGPRPPLSLRAAWRRGNPHPQRCKSPPVPSGDGKRTDYQKVNCPKGKRSHPGGRPYGLAMTVMIGSRFFPFNLVGGGNAIRPTGTPSPAFSTFHFQFTCLSCRFLLYYRKLTNGGIPQEIHPRHLQDRRRPQLFSHHGPGAGGEDFL